MASIGNLPVEVLAIISQHLSFTDTLHLRQVSDEIKHKLNHIIKPTGHVSDATLAVAEKIGLYRFKSIVYSDLTDTIRSNVSIMSDNVQLKGGISHQNMVQILAGLSTTRSLTISDDALSGHINMGFDFGYLQSLSLYITDPSHGHMLAKSNLASLKSLSLRVMHLGRSSDYIGLMLTNVRLTIQFICITCRFAKDVANLVQCEKLIELSVECVNEGIESQGIGTIVQHLGSLSKLVLCNNIVCPTWLVSDKFKNLSNLNLNAHGALNTNSSRLPALKILRLQLSPSSNLTGPEFVSWLVGIGPNLSTLDLVMHKPNIVNVDTVSALMRQLGSLTLMKISAPIGDRNIVVNLHRYCSTANLIGRVISPSSFWLNYHIRKMN